MKPMAKFPTPVPLFDSLEQMDLPPLHNYEPGDITHSMAFLKSYVGSKGTFNSYRREIERLLHWSHLIAKKSLRDLKREDIEAFLRFCQAPPIEWVGTKKAPRFMDKEGLRCPNPEWRPFVATVSKSAHRKGDRPDPKDFEITQGSVREMFAILSSYFNYLVQEDYVLSNPVALIRQKSKFIRKHQQQLKIRRLSDLQWHYVIKTAQRLADESPEVHERTYFIMSALYSMYLRISELCASERWEPTMRDFHRDQDGNWWFTTVSKGNKQRDIAVSDAMLDALRRWRGFLNLSALPTPADKTPMLPKQKGKGPITSTTYVRRIVQYCFDQAIEQLHSDKLTDEAEALLEATVHWLRHTGISEDVKHRPREHVRDDAGHGSSAITDKYIDVELRARHESAKGKQIAEKD